MTAKPNPILICGPTASGKSALGLEVSKRVNGVIINADALQVYDNWRILTARPDNDDENLVEHRLYGHIPANETYSVGTWLREVSRILKETDKTPIILGGTGLYFTSLTNGLTDIPQVPQDVRAKGDDIRNTSNTFEFIEYLAKHDPETLRKTDKMNAMRLQRAWEVHYSTGRGLASWQKDTPAPLVNLEDSTAINLISDVNWLNTRIEGRFDKMLQNGALDECRASIANGWNPTFPSSRALGAAELISYLQGEISLQSAKERATILTRQFAKRQRTWFRNKMQDWQQITLDNETNTEALADRVLGFT